MKRILLLSFMLSFVFTYTAWAQRTVSGRITDESGESVPGVNVILKGTTTGTTTDLDGNYRLSVPEEGGVLVFSFIGLATQEVEIGARSVIDAGMQSDVQELTEVVVTALGSDRNAREVVYANQTVKGDQLLSTPNKSTLEALRGKTAGVRLSTGSGSVGASTRIVLRAESSLTGDNNALIVVDGIAINNDVATGGAGTSTTGYADHGNRFNDINPDDIESITILKGPSATSLYGSRGASGVVLITTKKGGQSGRKMQLRLNSSYSVEQAYVLVQRQNKFGQGYNNESYDTGENWSWGPAFTGVERPWTSAVDPDGDGAYEWLSRPYSAVDDQIENFFQNGRTISNSVALSGASNNGFTYYGSYSNVDQIGTQENTYYKRNTLLFNAAAPLTDKLTSSFKVSYANTVQNTGQEGSRAFEGNNAYAMVLQSPVNIPFHELRDYKSPYHDVNGYWGSYSSVNPYLILNEYGNEAVINNFLGNTTLTYKIMDGLSINGRLGANIVNTKVETWTPVFTPQTQLIFGDNLAISSRNSKHVSPGDYTYYNQQSMNIDYTATANYTRQLTNDLQLDVVAGYNYFQRTRESITGETQGGLVVEGVYNFGNSVSTPLVTQDRDKYRIYGLLGNARLGWRDAVFLEYSFRRDVSSTLPASDNAFPYMAVGGSIVVDDLLEIDESVLSFLKIRGSFGSTGKDAGLYQTNSTFVGNPEIVALGAFAPRFPLNGQAGITVSNRIGNPNLTPEQTLTMEVGADVGFFDERINVTYTYYSSEHKDQIVDVSLPRSTGYTVVAQNIGLMTNKGHELSANVKPIYGLVEGLNLELYGTWSKNINEVVEVGEGIDELVIGGPYTPGVSLVARKGLPFGTFKALDIKTNDDGQVIVDPVTGYPVATDGEVYLGSYQPDYLASFGMNANYKGFGFNILFDYKAGGNFVSQTMFFTEFNGTSVHTARFNREAFVYPNSVFENEDGTYTPNNIEINEQALFTENDVPASTYLIDASFLKLREIGVSYDLPAGLLGKSLIRSARVAVFAKNLKFWLPEENTFADPEINGPSLTGNAQGIETTQTPPSRSFGVNLQLTF